MKSLILSRFKKLVFVHLFFLLIMSIYRVVFFFYYNPHNDLSSYIVDILKALFLGFRLDLTVIGYIQVIPTILLIVLYYINKETWLKIFDKLLLAYIFMMYTIVAFLIAADFGFYSYFKDHINIIFFGLIDDDTWALMQTFWQNYNVVLILSLFFIYLVFIFIVIKKVISSNNILAKSFFGLQKMWAVFIIIFVLNFLAIRGTLGMYPLGKMLPNISEDHYINQIAMNGVRAYTNAQSAREKYLKRKYDLIKATGFKNNIEKAFEIYKGPKDIDSNNLLENITYKTKTINDQNYNVVVIMVESFGMPILKYQSDEFDIMGNLKKHFEEDILFTNFISSGDGTISSLQALLLNIPHRPSSFAFSQSIYKQTSFTYSPAFLYNDAGYETSFIYGGDLSWRDLGKFIRYQGYDHLEGKINIFNGIESKSMEEDQYFHPWGIFDEHLYEYLFQKLVKSDQKQFMFALSTNNHPPYNIPHNYTSKIKSYSQALKDHITGDFNLAKQRLVSYAYALDQVGIFLDKIKKSKLKDNTIVVVTADNNTIDGIMKYDDNELLNSKNIPLYFYLPTKLKKTLNIDTKVFGSHKDIFPTLYNLTLDKTKHISIGFDLFDNSLPHFGFNGSKIVAHNGKIKQYKNLKNDSNDQMQNFYRANLAITQYLIDRIYKEKIKNDR